MPRHNDRAHRAWQVLRFAEHLGNTEPHSQWLEVLQEVDPDRAYTTATATATVSRPQVALGNNNQGDHDLAAAAWPISWDLGGHGHFGTFLRGTYRKWVREWRASSREGEWLGDDDDDSKHAGEAAGVQGENDGRAVGGDDRGRELVGDDDYRVVAREEGQEEAVEEMARRPEAEERQRSPSLGPDEAMGLGISDVGNVVRDGVFRRGADRSLVMVPERPGAAAGRGMALDVLDVLLAASPTQQMTLVALVAVLLLELGLYAYFFLL